VLSVHVDTERYIIITPDTTLLTHNLFAADATDMMRVKLCLFFKKTQKDDTRIV